MVGGKVHLQELKKDTFIDVACYGSTIMALSSRSMLSIIETNEKVKDNKTLKYHRVSKYLNLKVHAAYSLTLTENWIITGCADGTIRFFLQKSWEHLLTLPKTAALGRYNVEPGVSSLHPTKSENYPDCVAVSFNEKTMKFASLYSDRTYFIWDMRDLEKISIY